MASQEIRWAISDAIRSGLPKCGECSHWMKSSLCPREHNVKGMSRGPSSGEAACDKFLAKDAATAAHIAERMAPITKYLARPLSPEGTADAE